ncbi:hypothetical protein FLK61_34235 [Paenalkalicoccus suaedae]|uniref:Uncharacterized protein n=1 Tax=Paenalkalicoccus suaedae TaxID=2592382 RepID=A0A859FGB9_9BACI|nr:hypothetical protein [Paenalkalicoccus suaedae]QKS71684.1 hypothetical protein FLK61_33940 [Paenalkalicoccus suaedae]QKS71738.1 hypothetical protein FLK61_34235 [Paenalkalicoccus suaedae]
MKTGVAITNTAIFDETQIREGNIIEVAVVHNMSGSTMVTSKYLILNVNEKELLVMGIKSKRGDTEFEHSKIKINQLYNHQAVYRLKITSIQTGLI